MGLAFFSMLGSMIADTLKSWMKTHQIKAKHKVKMKEKQLEAELESAKRSAEVEADWDRIQAKNSLTSWKSEFWTLILAAPLIMCFIPGMAPYAYDGFKNLEQVPEWYIIAVGVAIASAFGFRKIVTYFAKRKI